MGAAVMSISRAARGGITRTKGIMGVVQKRPILTPGWRRRPPPRPRPGRRMRLAGSPPLLPGRAPARSRAGRAGGSRASPDCTARRALGSRAPNCPRAPRDHDPKRRPDLRRRARQLVPTGQSGSRRAVLQPQQQLTGESVAPLGTVEREPDDALMRFVNQAVWGRAKGTFLIVAARCPVCGEPVCLDRSTYQNNYECPLRLPTNEITRTTSPDSLVYKPNNLTSHQASIGLILVSASPALMATFTASSIGSLKGTSIRSRPCS